MTLLGKDTFRTQVGRPYSVEGYFSIFKRGMRAGLLQELVALRASRGYLGK
jgi:hypothetical protein